MTVISGRLYHSSVTYDISRRVGPSGVNKPKSKLRSQASFVCRDAQIPYEVLQKSNGFELRFYEPRYVVEAGYEKRDSAFIQFDKYLTGSNEADIKMEALAPVVMQHDQVRLQAMFLVAYKAYTFLKIENCRWMS